MIPTENRGKEYERISSKAELRAAKDFILNEFDFDSDVELDVAKSFKRKAGEFNPVKGKVRISKYLLDNHPEKVFRTLKHELAHAEVSENSERSKPHGKEWKSVMRKLGVDDPKACHDLKLADYNYAVKCSNPDCGMKIGRYKKSKLVKKPQLYRCIECGDKLVSSKVTD